MIPVLSTLVPSNKLGLFSKDSQGARLKITVSSRESFEANLGERADELIKHIRGETLYPAWHLLQSGYENAKIVVPVPGQLKKARAGDPFRARLTSDHHEDVSVGVRFL
ncbi:MAG: hypothetical protein ACJKSS_00460 [Patescibacteria group bacterium UBA2103]